MIDNSKIENPQRACNLDRIFDVAFHVHFNVQLRSFKHFNCIWSSNLCTITGTIVARSVCRIYSIMVLVLEFPYVLLLAYKVVFVNLANPLCSLEKHFLFHPNTLKAVVFALVFQLP